MEIINGRKRVPGAAASQKPQRQADTPPASLAVDQLALERVLGCGSATAGVVAAPHPTVPGLIAYTSGSVVVLWDSSHKQQVAFFRSKRPTHRQFVCLAFSKDGAYLAAGERGGAQSAPAGAGPEVVVWEVSTSRCLKVLRGHKYGVSSVCFSSDGRLLVSTGESYDGQLCVWNWNEGTPLVKQHTQAEVVRACFVEESSAAGAGATITTIGKAGHFKVWTLSLPTGRGSQQQASLVPRPTSLKEYRNSSLVAVAAAPAGPGAQPAPGGAPSSATVLYALTQQGVLLTLKPASRTLDKSVSLQVPSAFGLAVSPTLVACACASGVVRLFATRTLAFKSNLPRPTARGAPGVQDSLAGAAAAGGRAGRPGEASAAALFPDAVSCAFDCTGERLTVCYADRSLVVWDVRNPNKVVRSRIILSHAGSVFGAALIPAWQAPLVGSQQQGVGATPGGGETPGTAGAGPASVLCTCASDGTVRLWNVCLDPAASTAGPIGIPHDPANAARVTRTLRAIIYAAQPSSGDGGAGPSDARRCAPDAPAAAAAAARTPSVTLRCLRVSPCGRHVATGDSRGNLRVHSLLTLQQVLVREAHDTEILSLDYSPPALDGSCYLASASRDCLVHVYDMSRGYELVGTDESHSAAVTAVRFSASNGRLSLVSCSADKSVVFRHVQVGPRGLSFAPYHTERLARGALFDLAVDPSGGRAVAVGQGGQLRVFDVATGRAIRNLAGDPACGDPVSVVLDPSGRLAVCSCADGGVAVYDVDAGKLMARGWGHGEVCTASVLLEDHRGLLSVGGDGCALMWRLTPALARRMQEAAAECRKQLEQQATHQAATPAVARRKAWGLGGPAGAGAGAAAAAAAPDGAAYEVEVDLSATLQRVRQGQPLLSVDKLPRWALNTQPRVVHVGDEHEEREEQEEQLVAGETADGSMRAQPALQGKWAQRVVGAELQGAPQQVAAASAGVVAPGLEEGAGAGGVPGLTLGRVGVVLEERSPGRDAAWADDVEDDDDIVLYDNPEEDEQLGQVDERPGSAGGAAAAEAGASQGDVLPQELTGASRDGSPEEGHQLQGEGEEQREEMASGCASNCMGGGQPGAAAGSGSPTEGDTVRRDLFREHFGTLALDQGSAAKPRGAQHAPDPRRQSLSLMYRQTRGSLAGAASAIAEAGAAAAGPAAGAAKDPNARTPGTVAAPAPPPGGAGAAAPGAPAAAGAAGAAAAGGSTPYLAKVPVPLGITTTRGATPAAVEEADGGITSAAWTPERAMLPLTSPLLADTDKQLLEMQRLKERLMASTLKRQQMDKQQQPDGAQGGAVAQAADGGVPATAAVPVPAPTPVAPVQSTVVQVLPAAGPRGAEAPGPTPGHPPAQQLQQATPGAAAAAAPWPRSRSNSSGGSATIAASVPEAAPVRPASPGFSALSLGTPLLGQATPCGGSGQGPTGGNMGADGSGAGASAGATDWGGFGAHLHVNPMYGATPGTPVMGMAVGAGGAAPDRAAAGAPAAAGGATAGVGSDGGRGPGGAGGGTGGEARSWGTSRTASRSNSRRNSSGGSGGGAPLPPPAPAAAVVSAQQPAQQLGVSPRDACAADGATASPMPARASAEEVIQQVLSGASAAAGASGVCIVGGVGAAPEQGPDKLQRQLSPGGAGAALAAGPPVRPKPALPAIKPRPSASANGLRGMGSGVDSPGMSASNTAASAGSPVADAAASAECDAALASLCGAVSDFAAAYHHLCGSSGVQRRLRQGAQEALGMLAQLLQAAPKEQAAAAATAAPGDAAEVSTGATMEVAAAAPGPAASPGEGAAARLALGPAEVCSSPRTSVVSVGAEVGGARGSSVGGSQVATSQVVVEVGAVESMVQEKVQQQVQQQMRMVEEIVAQRIMSKLMRQQQQAATGQQ